MSRRPRRGAAVVVALGAVTLGAVALLRPRSDAPPPRPVETVAPVPVAVDDADRDAFVARIADGGPARIAGWLAEHGGLVPGGIGAGTTGRTLERTGRGPAVVPLAGAGARAMDGRITVVLVLGIGGPAAWRTVGTSGTLQVQEGPQAAGVPSVGTTAFPVGERPTSVAVDVADSVPWALAAVFSD